MNAVTHFTIEGNCYVQEVTIRRKWVLWANIRAVVYRCKIHP